MSSSQSTKIRCSTCQASLRVTVKYFGKRVPCPQCRTLIDIPDPKEQKEESLEVLPLTETPVPPEADSDLPDAPFDFTRVDNRIRKQLRREQKHPTSKRNNAVWRILSAGLLLQGSIVAVFLVTSAYIFAELLPVVVTAVTENSGPRVPPPTIKPFPLRAGPLGNPAPPAQIRPPTINAFESPTDFAATLGSILDGCILLLVVSHIMLCFSPQEVGVRHIAFTNVMADLSVIVIALLLMLIPSLTDSEIVFGLAGVVFLWGSVQHAINCWFLHGCSCFSENKRLLNQAWLIHCLSVPTAFGAGLAMTLLVTGLPLPSWLGWPLVLSGYLMTLIQYFTLVLSVIVAFRLAWIMPRLTGGHESGSA